MRRYGLADFFAVFLLMISSTAQLIPILKYPTNVPCSVPLNVRQIMGAAYGAR